MPNIDALYELIHSLEQSEKRYFKIFAKRHAIQGQNQYLRLFDILESMSEYDEEKVKCTLGDNAFSKNLPSGKNYLYNLLLRSLRSYNSSKSAYFTLHELLLDIKTLIEKGLLQQAAKLIRKAKKLAMQYHYEIPLLEIILMERKLIRRYTSNYANEKIDEAQQESSAILQRITQRLKMLDLYETMFLTSRNENETQQSQLVTVTLAEELIAEAEHQTPSFELQTTYHMLHVQYYYLIKDFKKRSEHLRALIALYDTNPFMIDEDQEPHINILNNYLTTCFYLDQLDAFQPILQKMKSIKAKNFKLKSLIFNHFYYLEVLYRLVRKEYKEVISMVPMIEEGLKTYAANITKSRELTFIYNIAIAYFLEKDYPKALDWINRILNESKLEERQDIQDLARIFQIVLHYQLENHDFTESLILSANRHLLKKDKRQSAEYIIANHLKQALYSDKKKERAVFSKLEAELQDVKGLEEIKIWVASKI
ncbi:MAG: hypothetical protein IPJ74_14715 [Saprospiraceae bacterium]|nr:hypothetical protein [Saprospiraceae bacterium]